LGVGLFPRGNRSESNYAAKPEDSPLITGAHVGETGISNILWLKLIEHKACLTSRFMSKGEYRAATETLTWNTNSPDGKHKRGDALGGEEYLRRKGIMKADGWYNK
jgi:hypothetical protein